MKSKHKKCGVACQGMGVQVGRKFGNIQQNFKTTSPAQQFYVGVAIPGKKCLHRNNPKQVFRIILNKVFNVYNSEN